MRSPNPGGPGLGGPPNPPGPNAGNESDWSSVYRFTVTIHKTPRNGDFTTDSTPKFRWAKIDGATSYQLQIDTDPGFSNPTDITANGTSHVLETPLADGFYYWRMRGLFPGGGSTVKLPRQISFAQAMEVLLTAEPISARKAYEFGIVNEVVPLDELMPTAMRYAELICQNGPVAVRKVKESVLKGLALPLKEALDQESAYSAEVFSTEDAMEGIKAFQEKRKPVWKGR